MEIKGWVVFLLFLISEIWTVWHASVFTASSQYGFFLELITLRCNNSCNSCWCLFTSFAHLSNGVQSDVMEKVSEHQLPGLPTDSRFGFYLDFDWVILTQLLTWTELLHSSFGCMFSVVILLEINLSQIFFSHSQVLLKITLIIFPVPAAEKHGDNIILPLPHRHCGADVLEMMCSISILPPLMLKKFTFCSCPTRAASFTCLLCLLHIFWQTANMTFFSLKD